MHEIPLLVNITLALVVAFFGGLAARRFGLPPIVGYLVAGIAIGPFTPGLKGDVETIQQLAELGVIFLMFGVGLHFSFQDLWKVRSIAIPGALTQTALATLLGYGLSQIWGWTDAAGIVFGLSISVASTVVLLRGLMDNSLLNTPHGQAAVGWLVMEDILSVLILVLMPVFAPSSGGNGLQTLGVTLVKAAAFFAVMFFAGARFIPWLLNRIAHTRSRELFILAVLAITLGTALGAAGLFGVSLALGAFVAGAIVSQSHLSHQVGADVLPFREAFSVLFFVSVGMLVNPVFLWQNAGYVAVVAALVMFGKMGLTLLMGLFFPWPARSTLVVAVGLSQIGEFSFILGQGGLSLGMLTSDQYSLILAAALISISANSLMYRLMPALEALLRRMPVLWRRLDTHTPLLEVDENLLEGHVVIVGFGRVGGHLVDVLKSMQVPLLVIESDVERIEAIDKCCITALYGDAANSEVMTHAGLARARALVVTLPDESDTAMVVSAAHDLNPDLPIVARAATAEGVRWLAEMGARRVVHPELEGGLEMVTHTLLQLGFPLRQVHEYAEAVRRDRYDTVNITDEEHRSLRDLLTAYKGIEIVWLPVEEASPIHNRSLFETNIRLVTGASVVAVIRDGRLTANPTSDTVFAVGDTIGMIGDPGQIEAARKLMDVLEIKPTFE